MTGRSLAAEYFLQQVRNARSGVGSYFLLFLRDHVEKPIRRLFCDVCPTAFSLPTFSASCRPEPSLASVKPLPAPLALPGRLPNSFMILSSCAEAGFAPSIDRMIVSSSFFTFSPSATSRDPRTSAPRRSGGGDRRVRSANHRWFCVFTLENGLVGKAGDRGSDERGNPEQP